MVPGATFTWTASHTSGASVTGFTDCSSSCDTIISDVLTNSTVAEPDGSSGSDGTVVYQVEVTENGCSDNFNIVVTVRPDIIELDLTWNSNFVEDFIEVCVGAEALSSNDIEVWIPDDNDVIRDWSYFSRGGDWDETWLYGPSEEGPWIELTQNYSGEGPYQQIVDFSINDRLGYHYFVLRITDPATGCEKLSNVAILNIVSSLEIEAGGPDFMCSSSSPSSYVLEGAGIGGIASSTPTARWSSNVSGDSFSSTSFTQYPGQVTYTPPANYSGDITLTLTSMDPGGGCDAITDERIVTVIPSNSFDGCLEPTDWLPEELFNSNGYLDTGNEPCAVKLVGSNNGFGTYGSTDILNCSGAGTLSFDWSFAAPDNTIVWHKEGQKEGDNNGSSSRLYVAPPADLELGDLIIVTIHVNANTGTITDNEGEFTQIRRDTQGSDRATVASFWKLAGPADVARTTDYRFNMSNVTSNDKIYSSRVTGHDQSNPIGNSNGATAYFPYQSGEEAYRDITVTSVAATANSMLVAALTVDINGDNELEYPNSPVGMTTVYYDNIEAISRVANEGISGSSTGDRTFSWPSYNSRNRDPMYAAAQIFLINPATPDVDEAYYLINGTAYSLSTTDGESGTINVSVNSGDEIGFGVSTDNNSGGAGELTLYNLDVPNDAPVATGDTAIVYTECQPAGFDPDTAYVEPTVSDECDTPTLQTGYPITSATTTVDCENSQSRTWLYVDDCDAETDPFTQTITWTLLKSIVLTCPANDSLGACLSSATIQTAYDNWKLGFSATGGCGSVVDNINEFPVLTDLTCGGELSFTYVVYDACDQIDSCTSVFYVRAADDLALTCPNDTLMPACTDTADIRLAYNAWKAGFTYSGGCSTVTSNIDSIPELPDLSCGGQIDFRFEVNLGSSTCPNSIDCYSVFEVETPQNLLVNLPADVTLPLCSDTTSIRAAYTVWAAGFSTTGGCDVTTNIDALPVLTDLTCGGTISFIYTAENGVGKCADFASDTATFSVIDPPPLTLTCPVDPNLPGCAGSIAITSAYNIWVDGFTVSGGCDITSNIDSIPPLGDLLCDGQLSFTFIATSGGDVCTASDSCTSTFTLGAADALIVSCPGDTIVEGCTAAEVQGVFTSWIAGFSYTGGCNVSATDLSIYTPPGTCGGVVTVNYMVNDECGQADSCIAQFSVTAPLLTISYPDDTLQNACQTQAEVDVEFGKWISQFGFSGGCNVLATDTSLFSAPDICGGTVVINYSASDACGQVANHSTFFAIDFPNNVLQEPSFDVPADFMLYSDAVCAYDADPAITGVPSNLADNCTQIDSLVVTYSDSITDGVCLGEYIIYRDWEVTDNCLNRTIHQQLINVSDTIPPVIICANDTSETADPSQCYKSGFVLNQPTATDNCTPDVQIALTNDAPAQFPVGTTVVTWTASDDCGNSSTCTQNVTVIDITPPDIDISGCQDVTENAAANNCSKVPDTMLDPVYSDDCWPVDSLLLTFTVTGATDTSGIGTASGVTFNVGVSNVKYVVSDPDGNEDSCSFTVTIVDITPPGIDIGGCVDVAESASANNCDKVPVTISEPTYSDNCWPVDSLTLIWTMTGATTGSGSGSVVGETFNVGVTNVQYVVSDPDGNEDSCSFTVTIVDVTPPAIDLGGCVDVAEDAAPNNCSKIPVTIIDPVINDVCWPLDSLTLTWTMTGATTGSGLGSVVGETFNVGVTNVQYVVSDPDGNSDSCSFSVTIVDVTPPGIQIGGCVDVSETAAADNCSIIPATIADPTYSDDCWPLDSLTINYTITGATVASGTGSVVGETFNVGISTVQYIVSDPDGNEDSCSFDVTIIHLNIPTASFTCPTALHTATALDGNCDANLSLDALTYVDPCNEIDSVWNNSPYRTSASDASGTYPVDTTVFYWYITDISGNVDSCEVTVIVEDLPPTLVCPPDFTVPADFNQSYATNVAIPEPTHDDNCIYDLYWIMSGVTIDTAVSFTGINTVPTPYPLLNIGVTTVTYYLIDIVGDTIYCDFNITVLGAPDIDCPPDTVVYLDGTENNCDANFNPGVADLIQGVPPITWTYTITYPDGSTETDSYIKDAPDQFANPLGDKDFPLGVTTIEWRAENISGFDTCSHWVEVIDTIPPDLTTAPYENCVNPIIYAIYNPTNPNPDYGIDANLEKSPSPDYRLFEAGDTALDLLSLEDNCCDSVDMTVNWRIEFTDVPDPLNPTGSYLSHPDITGTGQPSLYTDPITGFATDIQLWGDGVTFTSVTHHIFYWVEDCNGNTTEEQMEEIIITPRPEIIKNN